MGPATALSFSLPGKNVENCHKLLLLGALHLFAPDLSSVLTLGGSPKERTVYFF